VNHHRRAVIFPSKFGQLTRVAGIYPRRPPHAWARREYLERVCADFVRAFGGFEDAACGRKVKPYAGIAHLSSV
jgi:hypothetical protein